MVIVLQKGKREYIIEIINGSGDKGNGEQKEVVKVNLHSYQNNIQEMLKKPKIMKEYFDFRFFNMNINEKVLYIHFPFCIKKCRYCVCQSGVLTDCAEKDFVEKVLFKQIDSYRTSIERASFDQIYFGGGTPTILSAEELDNIFQSIPNFESIPLKCIECSPETLSEEHIILFEKYKFSFLSMGVQSLDKSICKKQNRYHLSKDMICSISERLMKSNIYFNYDLICFMDKGDIRDLKQFGEELIFIMKECKPSAITIHQLRQAMFTCEKTAMLQNVVKDAIVCVPEYQCVNSLLQEDDVYNDTVYQAEYKLACRDYEFSHYMWNKFAALPVKGYDILSLGYTDKIHTISNAGQLFYSPGENKIKWIEYDSFIYDDYDRIRKAKGFMS